MNNKTLKLIALSFIAFNMLCLNAQAPYGDPGDHTPVPFGTSGAPFGYYEYLPTDFSTSSDSTFPLVLFYHGYGERGNGTTQLSQVLLFGPPKLIQQGNHFEAIVISPQNSDANYSATDFLNFYNYLITNYPVDTNRVYVTGLSSGGGSTWNALAGHFDKIAAAVPICGTQYISNPSDFMQQTPIWTFHSFNDSVVSRNITITNTNRIANNGGSVMSVYPYENGTSAATEDYSMLFDSTNDTWSAVVGSVQPLDNLAFTLYKDGGHDSWTETYNNSDVWDWMFAQSMNTLSLEEETIEYNLHPNPASDKLTINTTDTTKKDLEIYNLLGEKVYSSSFYNQHVVDVNDYAFGIYLAKIIDSNNTSTILKIVVN